MKQKISDSKEIITRIFFTEQGDLIVTDLWEEVRDLLSAKGLSEKGLGDEDRESL